MSIITVPKTAVAALLVLLTNSAAAQAAQHFGANLAGCEFAGNGALCPTKADVDWYVEKAGFTLLRIPVKGRQLLDPAIRKRVADVTAYAQTKRGVEVIIDRHDYQAPSSAADIAFWKTVLPSFSNATLIDTMNEPVKNYADTKSPWMEWAQGSRQLIAGIRKAGFKHRLLIEWPGYSATFRFEKHEAAKMPCIGAACALDRSGGFGDPLNRTYLSAHRYLDKGSSGTSRTCAADSGKPTASLSAFAAAARQRGMQAYITEVAFGSHVGVDASCAAAGAKFIAEFKANSDVLRGVTWWGGGRGWPDSYIFKIEPPKALRSTASVSSYVRQITGR